MRQPFRSNKLQETLPQVSSVSRSFALLKDYSLDRDYHSNLTIGFRLILICDECESTLCGVYYCDEHRHLDPRAVQENTQLLRDREKTLCGNLRSNCLKGRKCKTKRQALKKQLYEIRTLLAGEHDEGNSSAQHTSKGRSTCDE